MAAPPRPQIPAPLPALEKNVATLCWGSAISMLHTPDRTALQPCDVVVYKTLAARFKLHDLAKGGTNCVGVIVSSPLIRLKPCSRPSPANTYRVWPPVPPRGPV